MTRISRADVKKICYYISILNRFNFIPLLHLYGTVENPCRS